ncbi:inverse autotransporter beta domain-containing protein [Utexia brackfieldae]|uniref:inverse autotransporter beta domain-containing protein n=1 Tax=Utexia brackfieldae TaxID=3074108 RepID=UPI00370D4224
MADAAESPYLILPIWSAISATQLSTLETTTYQLKPGETAKSIAQKYHISVEALRYLNQSNALFEQFDQINDGDEIIVPIKPLKLFEQIIDNTNILKLAKIASQTGYFLADNPNKEKLEQVGRNYLANRASFSIQQWLSQYGNSRVKLALDSQFSLKTSQIDLLLPLVKQKQLLWFTQTGFHHTHNHSVLNLGMGIRYFEKAYMLGVNTFFDYDLSNYYYRASFGLEYWQDYLKLDMNTYLPIADWQDSVALTQYQEKPAYGWDMRAQGYLPVYPHLGGKLQYEHYYGDQVGLFGKNYRQKNPYAVTTGINYTPVTLVTFDAEHRVGRSKAKDSRLNMVFNYAFDVPFKHQIDANLVGLRRSVMGSRYDFVARNHHIVQQYQHQSPFNLSTRETIHGYPGQHYALHVQVNSQHGLARIDWDLQDMAQYGGQIIQKSGHQYSIVMPDFDPNSARQNTYSITATAYDKQGNVSNQAMTMVIVNPSDKSANS